MPVPWLYLSLAYFASPLTHLTFAFALISPHLPLVPLTYFDFARHGKCGSAGHDCYQLRTHSAYLYFGFAFPFSSFLPQDPIYVHVVCVYVCMYVMQRRRRSAERGGRKRV